MEQFGRSAANTVIAKCNALYDPMLDLDSSHPTQHLLTPTLHLLVFGAILAIDTSFRR